VKIEKLNKG